jgi:hypothetical protein
LVVGAVARVLGLFGDPGFYWRNNGLGNYPASGTVFVMKKVTAFLAFGLPLHQRRSHESAETPLRPGRRPLTPHKLWEEFEMVFMELFLCALFPLGRLALPEAGSMGPLAVFSLAAISFWGMAVCFQTLPVRVPLRTHSNGRNR